MGTDNIQRRKKGEKVKRKEFGRQAIPYRYLLVSEGEKTEPQYFEAIKKLIEEKYKGTTKGNLVTIDTFGSGRNTESLVEEAKKLRDRAIIEYGHVWCIFDKDSFTKEQFNNGITRAENEGMKVAWSNEAFELWYILHFEYLSSGITRKDYTEKLDKICMKHVGRKYQKNDKEFYNFLEKYGNQELAIKNSKNLIKNLSENIKPADSKPATKVYELVEELNELLK